MLRSLLSLVLFSLIGITASAQYASDWNPDADGDDIIGVNDLLALLSVFEETDLDNDGIFDSQDDCFGVYDECGVCNGTGLDSDSDGLCDDVDECVGVYDECGICNGVGPNFPIIEEVIYSTDSIYIPQLGSWYTYSFPTDTLFSFHCEPDVEILGITYVDATSATVEFSYSSISLDVDLAGLCWSTNENPTILNDFLVFGSSLEIYESNISNLLPNTAYFLRAFAQVGDDFFYSDNQGFTTDDGVATVTTSFSGFTANTTAVVRAEITSNGGSEITSSGFCWSTSESPTTNNASVSTGTSSGSFTMALENLQIGGTYYVRSFVQNEIQITYGNEIIVQLPDGASFPFIGQNYGGGKIAYIDSTGEHGLIASLIDISSGITWHSSNSGITGANGHEIGDGMNNTLLILEAYGDETNAASICANYTGGGFNDWFLPSIGELSLLCSNASVIGGFAGPYVFYWSSTENEACCAVFARVFPTCYTGGAGKNWDTGITTNFRVRPVRNF